MLKFSIMNEEEKKILLEIKEQVEDNSDILKGMRSKNRRETMGKIIYYTLFHHEKTVRKSRMMVLKKLRGETKAKK